MKHKSVLSSFLFSLMLSACVTINIYFPAAAAEDAARVIVRDVYSEEDVPVTNGNDQSNVEKFNDLTYVLAGTVLNMLITPAHVHYVIV